MKKILLLTSFFIFGIMGVSHAQLEEGNIMLGTDLGSGIASTTSNGLLSLNFGLNEGAGFDLGISPKLGYFLSDNFAVGAITNLGFSRSPESGGESTNTTVYGIQGFTRFYVRPAEARLDDIVRTGRFFLETNAGIAGVNIKGGPTTNGFAFGFGPGYTYFLNPNIALETSAKYNGLTGGGNRAYQHSLGLNLGIQVFLTRGQAENAVDRLD